MDDVLELSCVVRGIGELTESATDQLVLTGDGLFGLARTLLAVADKLKATHEETH